MAYREHQRKRSTALGSMPTKHGQYQDNAALQEDKKFNPNNAFEAEPEEERTKLEIVEPISKTMNNNEKAEPEEERKKLEIVEPISKTMNNNEKEQNQEEYALIEHKSDAKEISVSTQTERPLHVIIYGATGTLGNHTALEAAKVLNSYKWGIAGRCNDKLSHVLKNVSSLTNVECQNIPTFIVDANEITPLVKLAQKCQILINCCGNYEEYAPTIVKACIIAGTHYVDATINPRLMQQLHAEFHAKALSEKIYVITACGFYSFINQMGMNYIERNFSAKLQTVESYTKYCRMNTRRLVPLINRSTWNGAIAAMTNETACTFQRALQLGTTICSYKFSIARTDAVTGFSVPFTLIDVDMVNASQRLIAEIEQRPSVQFKNYLTLPTYFFGFMTLLWCLMLFILAQFSFTRMLLLKFPRLFSLGMCSAGCIAKGTADEVLFSTTFKATGICTCSQNELCPAVCNLDPAQAHRTLKANEKVLKLQISGLNPFFGFGCIALLSAAITILKQTGLPNGGGVFTPGAAFRNTDISKEVGKHNPHFQYTRIN